MSAAADIRSANSTPRVVVSVRNCARGDAAFDAYANSAPDATSYHDPRWLNAVEAAFGMTCYRWLAEREGSAVGMLPLAHVKSRLFGNFLISVPYGNFGGIVTTDDAARQPLLDEAIRLAQSCGARWIELRHIDPLPLDLACHTRKVLQTLDLTPGPDVLFKALASRTRNKIRKAEKNGITAEFVGRERLDDFYRIFARRMRDLGTPVYPRRFFDVVWDHLGESLRLLLVRRENVVMGGMFLYAHRTQVEFPWTAASMEYADLYPNMLLYWEAIRDSAARGFKLFDFGTSDAGGGVHQFKGLFGATDRPLHRQYWLAPGQEMPHLNPSNPRYAAKIRLWQKMPVWLTNIVGPMLARSLP